MLRTMWATMRMTKEDATVAKRTLFSRETDVLAVLTKYVRLLLSCLLVLCIFFLHSEQIMSIKTFFRHPLGHCVGGAIVGFNRHHGIVVIKSQSKPKILPVDESDLTMILLREIARLAITVCHSDIRTLQLQRLIGDGCQ